MICSICNKILKNERAIRSHMWRSHSEKGLNHIEKIKGSFKGRGGWNKGLTKDTDIRVKKYSDSVNEIIKKVGGPFKGKKHSLETKSLIGLKLSKNNKGGRCKWFDVVNNKAQKFKVQGTWEKDFIKFLNTLDDDWIKIGIGDKDHSFKWKDDNGIIHYYTPDFWSPKLKKYFEIKGYWWGKDKQKMKLVLEQNNINLEIIDKKPS